jgi:hypothetical protein
MPLIELWRSNPDGIKSYAIRQVVAIAGDGRIRDQSMCAVELRSYLRETTSGKLAAYAVECLEEGFEDSGFVLQDVVNEIGRRLEFDVENGRYRGKSGEVGFDGIWRVGSDQAVVVEVKTTDTYNARLEDVAGYREALIRNGRVPQDASTLFIVGRKDTGALEAQIRGSRYAWDMRVVGVESLVKLMHIKEKSTEDATVRQIRELLRPFEYTRVDRIVDVIFDTATDVEQSSDTAAEDVATSSAEVTDIHSQERTAPEALDAMRDRIVAALQRRLGVPLVRRRRALFESADRRKRVCITISKRHDREYQPYWYAYHPAWNDFLKGAEQAMFVLGCMDRDEAYAIPLSNFSSFLPKLNQTLGDGSRNYWHVIITPNEDGGLALYSSSTGDKLDLRPYTISLDPVSTLYTAHRAAG